MTRHYLDSTELDLFWWGSCAANPEAARCGANVADVGPTFSQLRSALYTCYGDVTSGDWPMTGPANPLTRANHSSLCSYRDRPPPLHLDLVIVRTAETSITIQLTRSGHHCLLPVIYVCVSIRAPMSLPVTSKIHTRVHYHPLCGGGVHP